MWHLFIKQSFIFKEYLNYTLSRGNPLALAVFYIIAVKNDIGLNKYEIQTLFGVIKSLVHSYNYKFLSHKSMNHDVNGFLDG